MKKKLELTSKMEKNICPKKNSKKFICLNFQIFVCPNVQKVKDPLKTLARVKLTRKWASKKLFFKASGFEILKPRSRHLGQTHFPSLFSTKTS